MTGITPSIIENFKTWLGKNTRQSDVIINATLSRVRIICNYAQKTHKVHYPINPFSEISIHLSKIKECEISVDTLQQIIQYQPTRRRIIVGRDMFLLSFYLGGMNFRDMLDIDFRNNTVSFCRTKTAHATHGENIVRFQLDKRAKEIAQKYMDKSGKLSLGYSFKTYQGLMTYVCDGIHKMAIEMKLKERVVFYSARKSFAQYAFDLGLPDSIVDYIIGHSSSRRGIIKFYSRVQQSQAELAMQRVFDYMENPDKYKDYIEMRADILMMKEL